LQKKIVRRSELFAFQKIDLARQRVRYDEPETKRNTLFRTGQHSLLFFVTSMSNCEDALTAEKNTHYHGYSPHSWLYLFSARIFTFVGFRGPAAVASVAGIESRLARPLVRIRELQSNYTITFSILASKISCEIIIFNQFFLKYWSNTPSNT